jgi:ABC-type transport system involved in multi-copper enzyme maturation permease subunit
LENPNQIIIGGRSEERSLWNDLVAQNPMLIEIKRFRRKFFTFGGNPASSAILALALVCYVGLIMVVLSGKGEIPPVALVMFQTMVLGLLAPAMLYGAIAGERERRSWDLLLVAPISKAQIVVGKFIGAMAGIGLTIGLCLLPVLMAAVTYRRTNWHDLFLSELVSASFALLVCALTLLLSARVRRGFMALGAALGTLAVWLAVVPLLLSTLVGSGPGTMELMMLLHPFMALGMILSHGERSMYSSAENEYVSASLWGYPQTLAYLVLTVVLVVWAAKTLVFAENDIRFMPKSHPDA